MDNTELTMFREALRVVETFDDDDDHEKFTLEIDAELAVVLGVAEQTADGWRSIVDAWKKNTKPDSKVVFSSSWKEQASSEKYASAVDGCPIGG